MSGKQYDYANKAKNIIERKMAKDPEYSALLVKRNDALSKIERLNLEAKLKKAKTKKEHCIQDLERFLKLKRSHLVKKKEAELEKWKEKEAGHAKQLEDLNKDVQAFKIFVQRRKNKKKEMQLAKGSSERTLTSKGSVGSGGFNMEVRPSVAAGVGAIATGDVSCSFAMKHETTNTNIINQTTPKDHSAEAVKFTRMSSSNGGNMYEETHFVDDLMDAAVTTGAELLAFFAKSQPKLMQFGMSGARCIEDGTKTIKIKYVHNGAGFDLDKFNKLPLEKIL